MIWFAIGLLCGKKVLNLVTEPNKITRVSIYATIFYILIVQCIDWKSGILAHIPWLVYGFPYTLGVIFVMLVLANQLEKLQAAKPICNVLFYVGANSIVFYLTHWPLWMYVFKPLGMNLNLTFVCIVLLEFPLIYIFNHYLPWCIGRKYKKNEK